MDAALSRFECGAADGEESEEDNLVFVFCDDDEARVVLSLLLLFLGIIEACLSIRSSSLL